MSKDRPEEAPGPQAVQEFMDSLQAIDGVEAQVAAILQRLHAQGRLNASSIVSALREARSESLEQNDGQDQTPQS
jgi:hypothetical protein